MLRAVRILPGRQSVRRSQRSITLRPAAAGGEVSPEGWRVEAVDDGVAAGVQVPKQEEGVVYILRCDAQHVRLEPVPNPQQVVRSPAHHKGQHDDHSHLQSLHASLWDDVSATATQVLQVDVQQDAAVAAAHHQQGDDVQRDEVKHVVNSFLPAVAEAAVSGTLSEVHGLHPDRPEDKQLQGDRQRIQVESRNPQRTPKNPGEQNAIRSGSVLTAASF